MKNEHSFLYFMLSAIAFCVIMYYGSSFLIPLAFGVLWAFLVGPINRKLARNKVNKYISALLSVFVIVLFFGILLSVFGWQINELIEKSDKIEQVLVEKQDQIQSFVKTNMGITFKEQGEYFKNISKGLRANATAFLGGTTTAISSFFLSLIYAILLLSERKRFRRFLMNVSDKKERARRTAIETSEVVQSYLSGKLIVISLLSVAYAIGFLIAGIPYAVLLSIFAAFLSFIPYVGNLIGGSIAMVITLATGGTSTDLMLILIIMSVAQIVESYILEPWIVGSNVDLNPFFAIFSVIAMSTLWGPAGAVIALPLAGAVRIIVGKTEEYDDVGYLMSNEEEE